MMKLMRLCALGLLAACSSAGPGSITISKASEAQTPIDWNKGVASKVKVFPQISGLVHSAVFSPDGQYALTGDEEGTVKIWEAASGMLVRSYFGHKNAVRAVAWSPNGKIIASGSEDGTIRFWNPDVLSFDMREINIINIKRGVYSIDFSPDSLLLVSGSVDQTVRVWNVTDGSLRDSGGSHIQSVLSAAFSPDGNYIASASKDASIELWDIKTGKESRTLIGHIDSVQSVAWSNDSRRLVSASADKTIRVWDIKTGSSQIIGNGIYNDTVFQARFSPDGAYIAAVKGFRSASNFSLIIWDAKTGAPIRGSSEHSNAAASVAWNFDGTRIITASYDTTAKLYDAQTLQCLKTFAGKTDALRTAALSNNGKFLVTGSDGKKINIWNAETGVLEHSLEHTAKAASVAVSPDNRLLAAGALALDIKLWNIETGEEFAPLSGHRNTVFALAFNPVLSGKQLASASADGTVMIWDTWTGTCTDTLSHGGPVSSITFSQDGRFLVSGSWDKNIRIWENKGSGQYSLLRTLPGHSDTVDLAAISPDSKKIVSASRDGTAYIWDFNSGRKIDTLSSGTYFNVIYSVSFSRDNKYIIASAANGKILRYELDDYGMTKRFEVLGETAATVSTAYSSDGKLIIAGMADGTARLYKAGDLSEIACFVYFTGEDTELAVTGRGAPGETQQAASKIDGEWLTITPDGFYRSSLKADRFINVLINDYDLYEMSLFSDHFYRPDVVNARLTGQPDPADMPPFTIQQAANFAPPEIIIRSSQHGGTISTSSGAISISVKITDKNRPIRDIRILVNGVRLGSNELSAITSGVRIIPKEGGLSIQGDQKSVEFSAPINLFERGSNRIEAMAYNGITWGNSGYTGSVNVNWEPPAIIEIPKPALWILAVGVNTYNNANTAGLSTDKFDKNNELIKLKNLNYSANDAKGLVESFEAQEGKRYSKVNSRLLTDEKIEPTAKNILLHMDFLKDADQRDVVLLFMAGHGINQGGRFYFLAKDAVMEKGRVDPEYAISGETLKSVLNMPGRRLIFIDACQSGGMDITMFMHSLKRTNAFILSSSEGDKPSYESERYKHGLFTYSIIGGLKGSAPRNRWAGLSVLGLSDYVHETVKELTKGIWFEHQQKPVPYSWGFGDFDIAW